MKYLQDYMEDKQTALFNKTGAIFAFSQQQFNEAKNPNLQTSDYTDCGAGMLCPTVNVEELFEGLEKIYKDAIEEDIAENGKEAIIRRELYNHEAFYTYDTTDTLEKLKDYPFTVEEVIKIFNEESLKQD